MRKGEGGWDGWLGDKSAYKKGSLNASATEALRSDGDRFPEGKKAGMGLSQRPLAEASCATPSLLTPCKAQPVRPEMLNVILLLGLLFIIDAALRCN